MKGINNKSYLKEEFNEQNDKYGYILREKEKSFDILLDGPKSLEEIRTSLKVTSSGMIPQIRKWKNRSL